jgi:hypothetical protein
MIANTIFYIFVIVMVAGVIIFSTCKAARDISSGNYHYSVIPGVPLVYSMGAGAAIVAMLMGIFAIGSITGFFEYFYIVLPSIEP